MAASNNVDDTKPWVLVSSLPGLASSREVLKKAVNVVIWEDFLRSQEEYRDKIQGILVIPSRKIDMPEDLIRSLPHLKVVATHSIGINHLDITMLRRLGLKFSYAFGVLDDTCADFTFGLLIAAARRLPECIKMAQGHDGTFEGFASLNHVAPAGVRVSGATLGILGMGAIGFEVARRAALGFKMNVLYHNRTRRSEEVEREVRATYCGSLDEMLPQIDFLVITAALNNKTKNMIGKHELSLMKPSAIVVNDARGPIIDQDALVEALKQGTIRGAALDVTTPEPLHKDHPLLHMPNVIVTAHMSSCVGDTMNNMIHNCVDNLLAGIKGRPLLTEVPLSA